MHSIEEQDMTFEKDKNVMIGYSLPQECHQLSYTDIKSTLSKSAALYPCMGCMCCFA